MEKWNKLFRFQGVESLKLSVGHFAGGFNRIDLMNVRDDGRWWGLVPRGEGLFTFSLPSIIASALLRGSLFVVLLLFVPRRSHTQVASI